MLGTERACSDVRHHLRFGAHLTQVIDRKVVISMDPIKGHWITTNPGLAPFLFHLLHLALGLIVLSLPRGHTTQMGIEYKVSNNVVATRLLM